MAVRLSANYSKKLGLPQYSSHSFSASVEVELTDLNQVESECQKLYQLLQQSVDQEIQQVGFVPDPKQYGQKGSSSGSRNGYTRNGNSQNGHQFRVHNGSQDRWACTDGQRGFILRITNENNLDKQQVEAIAQRLYGLGVKQLNKMQASQLIEEMLTMAGTPRQSRWQKPHQQAA
jgi:hypothetical protein